VYIPIERKVRSTKSKINKKINIIIKMIIFFGESSFVRVRICIRLFFLPIIFIVGRRKGREREILTAFAGYFNNSRDFGGVRGGLFLRIFLSNIFSLLPFVNLYIFDVSYVVCIRI